MPVIFTNLGEVHRRQDQFGQDHGTVGAGQQQTTESYCYGYREVSLKKQCLYFLFPYAIFQLCVYIPVADIKGVIAIWYF